MDCVGFCGDPSLCFQDRRVGVERFRSRGPCRRCVWSSQVKGGQLSNNYRVPIFSCTKEEGCLRSCTQTAQGEKIKWQSVINTPAGEKKKKKNPFTVAMFAVTSHQRASRCSQENIKSERRSAPRIRRIALVISENDSPLNAEQLVSCDT